MQIKGKESIWHDAILDGADACMLSGETAIGNFPIQAVDTMDRIMVHTEKLLKHSFGFFGRQVSQFELGSDCFQACAASLLFEQLSDLSQVDGGIHCFDAIGRRQRGQYRGRDSCRRVAGYAGGDRLPPE